MEALQSLLREIPPGSGMAFIVMFHLAPAANPLVPQLLGRATSLRVVEVRDGIQLEADHVHIAPAHSLVRLEHGTLHVAPAHPPEERRAPIDQFLHSLANDQKEQAVAVILSGLGTDGALGVRSVSSAGGMVLVQAPSTARHAHMPESAVATGAADHVLSPEQIAAELLAYAAHVQASRGGGNEESLREEVASVLPAVCEVLQSATGHDFKHYKTSTLVRRTLRRLQVLRLSAQDYVQRLRTDRAEVDHLFQDLLIGVTAFFRDPEAFEALAQSVLPRLFENHPPTEPVRIWVPGCATGEEAYTLAMLVYEQFDRLQARPEVQIFATDIDEHALSVARQGAYPLGIADDVSPERLRRFFIKKGQQFHISKELRELCLFSVHNLINDPPFSRLHLISCRNLLIYLGPHLQKKLFPLFHYALLPGGYLFLGPSENPASHRELFRPTDARHRISQRLPTASRPLKLLSERGSPPTTVRPPNVPTASDTATYLLMQRIILDEFAPKSVVVNEEGQIICASGNLEKYLTVSAGAFHNNIMRLAREGLQVALRAAITEAIRIRRRVVNEGLSLQTDSGVQRLMLTVQPMPQMGEDSGLFLVVFQDVGAPLDREEQVRKQTNQESATLIEQLERELATTREDLEKVIQDLETANEELKSSNEELLSMNEELQSANEELETSKEEVQAANEALARTNSDLENLLASTQIATLFLDEAGNIRRFTPAVTELYNVLPGDVGRPLSHITHKVKHMPPLPEPERVRQIEQPLDEEIEALSGRWYLRRVLPYRTHEGRQEGTVVTFTDVTEGKRVEESLREHAEHLRLAVAAGRLGTWEWDLQTNEVRWNTGLYELCGLSPGRKDLKVEAFFDLVHPEDIEGVRQAIAESLEYNRDYSHEFRIIRPDGQVLWLVGQGSALRDERGQVQQMFGINYDITQRKQAETEREAYLTTLQRTLGFSEMFVGILGHDLRNPLSAILTSAQTMLAQSEEPTARRRLERMVVAAQRMARMIEQLLDLTRARLGGGLPVTPTETDMGALCERVVSEFQESHPGRIKLQRTGDTRGQWDPDRLAQALSNLVGNALQHGAPEQLVQVRLDGSRTEQVVLEVHNEGTIPAERLPYLFEPFRGERRGESRGLGLGLYITSQIALAHGGSLTVDSTEQAGITFRLSLRRSPSQ